MIVVNRFEEVVAGHGLFSARSVADGLSNDSGKDGTVWKGGEPILFCSL